MKSEEVRMAAQHKKEIAGHHDNPQKETLLTTVATAISAHSIERSENNVNLPDHLKSGPAYKARRNRALRWGGQQEYWKILSGSTTRGASRA